MDTIEAATEIINRLVQKGYIAYFAGGWVRDHLMGHPSSDIDIATNAPTEVIMNIFPRTLPIGLAFGVVIVFIHSFQFEVSTFRKDAEYEDGRRPSSIEPSSPKEDALRRDFTINGMFYDPIEHIIHDYVHGAEDIKAGIIRTIGDPDERFREDRLRLIRAIRFASRFGYNIEQGTQDAIKANATTLFPAVAMERVWQEFNKMAQYPNFEHALIEMHRLEILPVIFPRLAKTHLNDIKRYVGVFTHFPKEVPTILYLMQLFPEAALQERLNICEYLRISNRDSRLIEYYTRLETLIKMDEESGHPIDIVEWVHCYANPAWDLCLNVIAARYPDAKRQEFLDKQKHRRDILMPHVERVQDKKPLVTAATLLENGIGPGKTMGLLLKEASVIAISQNCHDSSTVIKLLKETKHWPKDIIT